MFDLIASAFISAAVASSPAPVETRENCFVEWVTDGDTIKVRCDEEELRVRFCGIDAPEKDQEMGKEAHHFLIDRLAKGMVDLRITDEDRYGRKIAEVYHLGVNVNMLLTYKGLAWHYERYDNCPTKELIAMGERVAQKEEFNIWSLPSPVAPWDWRAANR